MDSYTFNNNISNDNSSLIVTAVPPVNAEDPTITIVEELNIGDDTTGYTFPVDIGLSGQVLVANTSTIPGKLDWGVAPAYAIIPGAVEIGSNDSTLLLSGKTGITIIGGIEYQYDSIELIGTTYNMLDSNYFVEITGSGDTIVALPEADTRTGKIFIISKGYVGGTLTINTQIADKIDGDDTIELSILNQRIQLISSGTDRWMVL
jgi:hypothetical protein